MSKIYYKGYFLFRAADCYLIVTGGLLHSIALKIVRLIAFKINSIAAETSTSLPPA
jgi:hypothetical protein